MTAILTQPADIVIDRPFPIRIVAAVATAVARARARRDYRQMLDREDRLLADMGVSRRDVRQALIRCGGRP